MSHQRIQDHWRPAKWIVHQYTISKENITLFSLLKKKTHQIPRKNQLPRQPSKTPIAKPRSDLARKKVMANRFNSFPQRGHVISVGPYVSIGSLSSVDIY